MIVDTMTKQEVMESLLIEFKNDIYPVVLKMKNRKAPLIKETAKREKRMVYLDWENIASKNMVNYRFRIWGNDKMYRAIVVVEFVWRGRKCIARIEPSYDDNRHERICVYQQHALERYAERVLKCEGISPENVFHKYLCRPSMIGMVITLPSRTHEKTTYMGHSDALFLCSDMSSEDVANVRMWANTCISYDEAGYTQSKMLSSFKELVSTIKLLGFNPVVDKEEYMGMTSQKKKAYHKELVRFFELHYMFAILQKELGMMKTESDCAEWDDRMAYLKATLEGFGVDCTTLNPYDKDSGIASEFDLNYMPRAEKKN